MSNIEVQVQATDILQSAVEQDDVPNEFDEDDLPLSIKLLCGAAALLMITLAILLISFIITYWWQCLLIAIILLFCFAVAAAT